jgi:hypothetical protein
MNAPVTSLEVNDIGVPQLPLKAQLRYYKVYEYVELDTVGENSYTEKTDIGAALGVCRAGLKQSLALGPTSFESGAAWSSDSKSDEG